MTKEYTHNSLITTTQALAKGLATPLCAMLAALMLLIPARATAFPKETYAEKSVLAEGHWVKISISESGVYRLSDAALRQLGFNDPTKVRIFGYGAQRLPEKLSLDTYIDDLPEVQAERVSGGLIFYGLGPTTYVDETVVRMRQVNNPFTTVGYYFLTDSADTGREIALAEKAKATSPVTTFNEVVFHEKDLDSAGDTGHTLLGESFLYNSSQTFTFDLPDREEGTRVWMQCSFMANGTSPTKLSFTVNGKALPQLSGDVCSGNSDSHTHYREARLNKEFDLEGKSLKVGLSISNPGTISRANLNYITVNYTRRLVLPTSGQLNFILTSSSATLDGASSSTQVWDVTDPLNITRMNATLEGSRLSWRNPVSGRRSYVAFNGNGALMQHKSATSVTNQNLHGLETPDMVIFTIRDWRSQAERLARIHEESPDSLRVLVIDQDLVFNEFSSGARDVQSFRKMLKMFYDRPGERKLQYVLFMGRGVYDNRCITPAIQNLGYPTMPIWETETGSNDTDSFNTDDIFAFLDDNTGDRLGQPKYVISVGRMPVTSVGNAKAAIDKIEEYYNKMPHNVWRNSTLIIADDDDNGVHMQQADVLESMMLLSDGGRDITHYKIYTDAYERVGGQYPKPRELMFKTLNEGVCWWFFIGHANTTSWTHERLLTYTDINNLYLKQYPILYAACCDFLRWDARSISAAEIMWSLQGGGTIAVISANRPTYISDNGVLSRTLGKEVFKLRADGTRATIGEILRNVKNSMTGDTNKLRYVLIGDPAMYPIIPDNHAVITSINGIEPGGDNPPEIKAREEVIMEGFIADAKGNIVNDFNGTINSSLHDAEYSVTTHGNGTNGAVHVFEQQGSRIFAGNDSVKDGRFRIRVAMPSEISNNYRPAQIKLYAHDNTRDFHNQAVGVNRDFYVFGEDLNVVDNEVPTIDAAYLNHPTFRNGDTVNPDPMLIAQFSDNRGINLSTSGIGHQMLVVLDEKESFNNVSEYYTPSSSGAPGGSIAFPLSGLRPGNHTIRLRVWDTSGNSASTEIDFFVSEDAAPTLFDIYADANPASVSTNFYLTHDRPDTNIEVTITVFDMLGRPVWSNTSTGRSDMYRSFPVTWNLTNNAGRRVSRGIYLYRASIKLDGVESGTKTKRIAVTGN